MYNQYELVEGGSKIHYIYLELNTVHEMCPKTKTIEYIESTFWYNKLF